MKIMSSCKRKALQAMAAYPHVDLGSEALWNKKENTLYPKLKTGC